MVLEGRKILLGVTGGIAAYKAVLLLRLLRRAGCDVRVVMTEAATHFVGPITFESLSEHPVHVHMFDAADASIAGATISPVEHIDLARWPDAVVVAPATANSIAGFAHGRADDLLATVVTACSAPVILAPAMNDVMWDNPATRENLRILSQRGWRIVDPETGDLACGYEAKGRMAEPATIFEAVRAVFDGPLARRCVLVSTGGTEEDLDPVRVISNRSSGRMGFAAARAAREAGADVTVVAGRTTTPPPAGVELVRVRTADEMRRALEARFEACDVLVMAAAVSDYRPAERLDHKHPREGAWTVRLEPVPDILAALGARRGRRVVVGFALETGDVEARARRKLQEKHCDLVVANDPSVDGAAFDHDTNVVTVVGADGVIYRSARPEPKLEIARRLVGWIAECLEARERAGAGARARSGRDDRDADA